jgi:hypothetical protein
VALLAAAETFKAECQHCCSCNRLHVAAPATGPLSSVHESAVTQLAYPCRVLLLLLLL